MLATRSDACSGAKIGGVLVLATRSNAHAGNKIDGMLVLVVTRKVGGRLCW